MSPISHYEIERHEIEADARAEAVRDEAEEMVRDNVYCTCGRKLEVDIDHLIYRPNRIYITPCPSCIGTAKGRTLHPEFQHIVDGLLTIYRRPL